MTNKASKNNEDTKGIFMMKGMSIHIPKGALQIKYDNSGIVSLNISPKLSLELCHIWLEIAFQHLKRADNYRDAAVKAKKKNDEQLLSNSLNGELKSSMQAIVASVNGLEAYYSNIKDRVTFSKEVTNKWRQNNTARHKQVAQVFQISFEIKGNEKNKKLNKIVKDIYKFRDWLVHPPGEPREPILDKELSVVTNWTYIAFSFHNAREIFWGILNLINQTSLIPKKKYSKLAEYCEDISNLIAPLLLQWKETYAVRPKR